MFKITLKFKTGRVMEVFAHAGMEVVRVCDPEHVRIEEVIGFDEYGEEVYDLRAYFRNCASVWMASWGIEIFDTNEDGDERSIAIIDF